jgi:hypothetical protein
LLARVTATELAEWAAYERVAGPLGAPRADLQAGIIAATVANANRGKGRAAIPADFIPEWDRKPAQTWQEQLAAVKALNRAMGGADTTKEAQRGGFGESARAHQRRR